MNEKKYGNAHGKLNLPPNAKMQECMHKSIFSDYDACIPLDVVFLIENGKNKCFDI